MYLILQHFRSYFDVTRYNWTTKPRLHFTEHKFIGVNESVHSQPFLIEDYLLLQVGIIWRKGPRRNVPERYDEGLRYAKGRNILAETRITLIG